MELQSPEMSARLALSHSAQYSFSSPEDRLASMTTLFEARPGLGLHLSTSAQQPQRIPRVSVARGDERRRICVRLLDRDVSGFSSEDELVDVIAELTR